MSGAGQRGRTAAVVAAFVTAGCSSHMYYSEAQAYVEAAQTRLVTAGLCKDRDDCRRREMVLFEAGGMQLGPLRSGGAGITVYGVNSRAVAEAIVQDCRALHDRYPGVALSLVVRSNTHGESGTIVTQVSLPAVEGGARYSEGGPPAR